MLLTPIAVLPLPSQPICQFHFPFHARSCRCCDTLAVVWSVRLQTATTETFDAAIATESNGGWEKCACNICRHVDSMHFTAEIYRFTQGNN